MFCTQHVISSHSASIMSKKLAESLDALVILLTYGSAAFMKTEKDARALSRILVGLQHFLRQNRQIIQSTYTCTFFFLS